ncbi:hypothetical protein J6590_012758 [Homalodisca vitripennis]|nr:hypothetical protein J6590_012758 [Homalodisca vitripennis]
MTRQGLSIKPLGEEPKLESCPEAPREDRICSPFPFQQFGARSVTCLRRANRSWLITPTIAHPACRKNEGYKSQSAWDKGTWGSIRRHYLRQSF